MGKGRGKKKTTARTKARRRPSAYQIRQPEFNWTPTVTPFPFPFPFPFPIRPVSCLEGMHAQKAAFAPRARAKAHSIED